jgi:prenylcysteine alpha-carboxyl methylesterase
MDIYFPPQHYSLFGLHDESVSSPLSSPVCCPDLPSPFMKFINQHAPWIITWLSVLFSGPRMVHSARRRACSCSQGKSNAVGSSICPPLSPMPRSKGRACACGQQHGVPIVVLVPGGAWTIGYKLWSLPTARSFTRRGFIVISLDYRNFPQTSIGGMVEDLCQAIQCIQRHPDVLARGGDPNNINVVGQSAGAHISTCAFIQSAIRTKPEWRQRAVVARKLHPEFAHELLTAPQKWEFSSHVRRVFAVSGPHDIVPLLQQFVQRGGVAMRFLTAVFESQFDLYSPTRLLHRLGAKSLDSDSESETKMPDGAGSSSRDVVTNLTLVHGKNDMAVPCSSSIAFAEACGTVGLKTEVLLLDSTHTGPILEGPFHGDDSFVEHATHEMWRDMHAELESECPIDIPTEPFLPRCMVDAAGWVNPF